MVLKKNWVNYIHEVQADENKWLLGSLLSCSLSLSFVFVIKFEGG